LYREERWIRKRVNTVYRDDPAGKTGTAAAPATARVASGAYLRRTNRLSPVAKSGPLA
jgi:hypothetical protein